VYWVDFSPGRGVEQAGRRPALVLQNNRGNESSAYTVVAAISSSPLPRDYPFTVPLDAGEAGLDRPCHVNCAQLLTIDQSRLGPRAGSLSRNKLEAIAIALRYELGI
jgi:mRNA interferase MazF